MSEHVPGPYTRRGLLVLDSENHLLADCRYRHPASVAEDWLPNSATLEERVATAELFTAAPELLAACSAALEWATGENATFQQLAEVVVPMLADAIAEAKGSQK